MLGEVGQRVPALEEVGGDNPQQPDDQERHHGGGVPARRGGVLDLLGRARDPVRRGARLLLESLGRLGRVAGALRVLLLRRRALLRDLGRLVLRLRLLRGGRALLRARALLSALRAVLL